MKLGHFPLAEEWRKDHRGVRQEGRNEMFWHKLEEKKWIKQYLEGRSIRTR